MKMNIISSIFSKTNNSIKTCDLNVFLLNSVSAFLKTAVLSILYWHKKSQKGARKNSSGYENNKFTAKIKIISSMIITLK